MNLNFHIEYQTVYGQDLILNIVSEKKKGAPTVSEYRMQTVDGVHWDCQVSCVIGTGTSVDYFYSIENGGRKERRATTSTTTGLTSPRTLISTHRPSPTA